MGRIDGRWRRENGRREKKEREETKLFHSSGLLSSSSGFHFKNLRQSADNTKRGYIESLVNGNVQNVEYCVKLDFMASKL
jgi:hypothetical protein